MAVPNKETRMDNPKLRSRQSKNLSAKGIFALFLSMAICILIFYESFRDSEALIVLEKENLLKVDAANNVGKLILSTAIDASAMVEANTLAQEDLFHKTLKQCLPQVNKKCKTFVAENSGQRIALLAPPGSLTTYFSILLKFILNEAKQRDNSVNIEFIPTTHIAPYGYGKTHGWTKIIRIVPVPLLLGAVDTLSHSTGNSSPISFNDIKSSLRQTIRYHCRLSHVAAHTSLWTLTSKELSESPLQGLVIQIQQFLGLQGEVDLEGKKELLLQQASQFRKMTLEGYNLLNSFTNSTKTDTRMTLNNVLLEELKISNSLTAWPCQSFWTVGDAPNREELSPLVKQIAEALSPDCEAPFTSCFVKRDKCEAKGDGKCSQG
jgi:hypothetical protein